MAALIDKDREPSARELRWFGVLFLGFCTAIAALLFWRRGQVVLPAIVVVVAAASTALYYAVPPLRRPLLRSWVTVTYPLGWLGSHLVLAVFFYLVLSPLGVLMRLSGRDVLQRRLERERPSYWVERRPPQAGADRYWHQY
jgi:hypothetical protein